MAYTENIEVLVPANGDLVSLGAGVIRDFKVAVTERLATLVANVDADPLTLKADIDFAGSAALPALSFLYFDGGSDTGIRESSANVLTLYAGGVAQASVSATGFAIAGDFTGANLFAAAAGNIGWSGRSFMKSQSDGTISLYNNAQTSFGRLNLGGDTASFPSIRRTLAVLEAVLADESAFANFNAGTITASGSLIADAAGLIRWAGRAAMRSHADSIIVLSNNAQTDFDRLIFGGANASFPALKRSGLVLQARLADDSAYTQMQAGSLYADTYIQMAGNLIMVTQASGVLTLMNTAQTDFGLLQLGGTTSSFPAIKRSGADIEFRLADDSARANIFAADGTFNDDLLVTGDADIGGSLTIGGAFLSDSPSGGIGYTTGAGDAETQATSKTTAVTINTVTGQITTHSSQIAAGVTVSFTVNNTAIRSGDSILVIHDSGGTAAAYQTWAHTIVNTTSFQIAIRNVTGGNLSEAIILAYVIIRGVTS